MPNQHNPWEFAHRGSAEKGLAKTGSSLKANEMLWRAFKTPNFLLQGAPLWVGLAEVGFGRESQVTARPPNCAHNDLTAPVDPQGYLIEHS